MPNLSPTAHQQCLLVPKWCPGIPNGAQQCPNGAQGFLTVPKWCPAVPCSPRGGHGALSLELTRPGRGGGPGGEGGGAEPSALPSPRGHIAGRSGAGGVLQQLQLRQDGQIRSSCVCCPLFWNHRNIFVCVFVRIYLFIIIIIIIIMFLERLNRRQTRLLAARGAEGLCRGGGSPTNRAELVGGGVWRGLSPSRCAHGGGGGGGGLFQAHPSPKLHPTPL